MKIIHLSDLHFHQSDKKNKKIITTLENVKNNYSDHYLLVTGDITDDGHERQYENAQKELKKFRDRVFIAPGNHDFGALGTFFSKERARRFDEKLSLPLNQGGTFFGENLPVVNVVEDGSDVVMFIALDTNLETESAFDFACGEVGDSQLNALDNILSRPTIPEMKKVLFFHHHPFMHNDPFMELKDANKLARVVYNRIDVMLFGHKHVMGKWGNRWGIKFILASDNSPGKNKAGEVSISDSIINMQYVDI